MRVELLHSTPLSVAARAIRKCWASEGRSDTKACQAMANEEAILEDNYGFNSTYIIGPADRGLIDRIGNKAKHSSTLEHIVYNFDIDGITRGCLQEVARHRHASLSVKSSRYTLRELRDCDEVVTKNHYGDSTYNLAMIEEFVVLTGDTGVDKGIMDALSNLQNALQRGISNDVAKYMLPEAYKTSLAWSVNLRSLQNFLRLRLSKDALREIQDLALHLINAMPKEDLYLIEDVVVLAMFDNKRIITLVPEDIQTVYAEYLAELSHGSE
jgi:thymidylate synthase (FAD)